jgi:hypothetical protein
MLLRMRDFILTFDAAYIQSRDFRHSGQVCRHAALDGD